MELSEVIKTEQIKLNMKARTKAEALEELTDLLMEAGTLSDKKAFLDDVYFRENEGITGIGNGIAIPHGKSKFVAKTSVAFGRVSEGLEWETVDEEPVKFIVLFAVKEEDSNNTHVKLLSKVASKLASEATCNNLLHAETAREVLDIFTK